MRKAAAGVTSAVYTRSWSPLPLLLLLLLLVLRIISISKKVESISSISALENPSATASTNWGGCIKMLPHVHHALAARKARRTWHFQPPHKGRPLIKLHKIGEFPHHWKGFKILDGIKRAPVSTILFLLVRLHSEPAVSCQKITTARPHLSSISWCKEVYRWWKWGQGHHRTYCLMK